MEIIWEIILQSLEIFTLVVGVLGLFLSLLLLFAPRASKAFSELCNRYIDVDRKIIGFIDKDIQTEKMVYHHNIITGIALIIGSSFILVFLFYRLDVRNFISIFFGSGQFVTTGEVVVSAMALIGKTAGVVGLLLGSILLFNPEQMRGIETKLNKWFATEPMFKKLETSRDVDTVIYRRPVTFGVIGLITSVVLTFLAFQNLVR